jgi:hypothetical protein
MISDQQPYPKKKAHVLGYNMSYLSMLSRELFWPVERAISAEPGPIRKKSLLRANILYKKIRRTKSGNRL